MESDTISSVPEGLIECLEALALPCLPPIPLGELESLEQTASFFFATDSREVRRMDYPEDRDSLLEIPAEAEGDGTAFPSRSAS